MEWRRLELIYGTTLVSCSYCVGALLGFIVFCDDGGIAIIATNLSLALLRRKFKRFLNVYFSICINFYRA